MQCACRAPISPFVQTKRPMYDMARVVHTTRLLLFALHIMLVSRKVGDIAFLGRLEAHSGEGRLLEGACVVSLFRLHVPNVSRSAFPLSVNNAQVLDQRWVGARSKLPLCAV